MLSFVFQSRHLKIHRQDLLVQSLCLHYQLYTTTSNIPKHCTTIHQRQHDSLLIHAKCGYLYPRRNFNSTSIVLTGLNTVEKSKLFPKSVNGEKLLYEGPQKFTVGMMMTVGCINLFVSIVINFIYIFLFEFV